MYDGRDASDKFLRMSKIINYKVQGDKYPNIKRPQYMEIPWINTILKESILILGQWINDWNFMSYEMFDLRCTEDHPLCTHAQIMYHILDS